MTAAPQDGTLVEILVAYLLAREFFVVRKPIRFAVKDKVEFPNEGPGGSTLEIWLRTAPHPSWEDDAIQIPYLRRDGQIARSSPMMPVPWAVRMARAGITRLFPEEDVVELLGDCIRRLVPRGDSILRPSRTAVNGQEEE